jgi:predicted amidohydrolase
MSPAWKNKEENLKLIEQHIKKALELAQDLDTLVFPELACTGYVLENNLNTIAENKGGELMEAIKNLAKRYQINLIIGFIEFNGKDKPYNSIFVVSKAGELAGFYRKIHLANFVGENKFYSAGKELSVFNLDGWKCGLAICFDIRYPRLFEALAQSGAEIVFIPANWIKGENKFAMLKFLTQTRAAENQIFCGMVDRAGSDPNTEYTASWMLADPLGNDISQNFENIYHIGVARKEKIAEVRKMIPLRPSFKDSYIINKIETRQ